MVSGSGPCFLTSRRGSVFVIRNASPHPGRLGRKLLIQVLLFSSIVTLVSTLIQLYLDYASNVSGIERTFKQIERSYLRPLSTSLWLIDDPQVRVQLEGILQLPDLIGVEVTSAEDNRVVFIGTRTDENVIERAFPLVHFDAKEVRLGELRVTATLSQVYQRLRERVLVILATQAVKTFLVSSFMLFLFQGSLTRHINAIAEHLRNYDIRLKQLAPKLVLDRRRGKEASARDEFDAMVDSINAMQDSAADSYGSLVAELQRSQRRQEFLRDMNDRLTRVALDMRATLSEIAALATPCLASACVVRLRSTEGEPEILLWEPQSLTESDAVALEARALTGQEGTIKALAVGSPERLGNLGTVALLAGGDPSLDRELRAELVDELVHRGALCLQNAVLYRASQHLNRAKDEFLAMVSHELRTPLNAIMGWTNLLAEGVLDPEESKQAIEVIGRNAQAQAQLVNDLLDVSQVVEGKITLNSELVEAERIIEESLESFRLPAQNRRQRLVFTKHDAGLKVRGDVDRLRQVFWNLVSNAVKFTHEGGEISVSLAREGTNALVLVQDSGKGIDPGFLPYVFERFRQEEGGMTRSVGGLGLGLAIVRHLVHIHGGSVSAYSEGKDKGALFKVVLPLA